MVSKYEKYYADWTKLYNDGLSMREIGRQYGCDYATVRTYLINIGIAKRSTHGNYLDIHDKWVEMYNIGVSGDQISKIYNCDKSNVYEVLRKHTRIRVVDSVLDLYGDIWKNKYIDGDVVVDIAKEYKYSKSCVLNTIKRAGVSIDKPNIRPYTEPRECMHYFDTIDSPDKCYFLGLLLADGGLCSSKYSVNISLKSIDGYMIDAFARLFNTSSTSVSRFDNRAGKIYYSKRSSICSKHLYLRLIELGIFPRKTYIDSDYIFNNIPADYMSHFLRGFFDGDGTIGIYNNRPRMGFVGCNLVMNKISNIIHELGFSYKKPLASKSWYSITWGAVKEVIGIMDYMYKDANIFLTRKRKIAIKVKEDYNNGIIHSRNQGDIV